MTIWFYMHCKEGKREWYLDCPKSIPPTHFCWWWFRRIKRCMIPLQLISSYPLTSFSYLKESLLLKKVYPTLHTKWNGIQCTINPLEIYSLRCRLLPCWQMFNTSSISCVSIDWFYFKLNRLHNMIQKISKYLEYMFNYFYVH